MSAPRAVVVDTNVVVAGLLTAEAASPTALVLDAMLAGRFVYLLSEHLLAECRAVLLRPRIRGRHGLEEEDVDDLLAEIVRNGIVREPARSKESPPDPADQHLWDLASSEGGAVIVTGDRALAESPPAAVRVRTARELVAILGLV